MALACAHWTLPSDGSQTLMTKTHRHKYLLHYDPVHTQREPLSYLPLFPAVQTPTWGWMRRWPLLCMHPKFPQVSVWKTPHSICWEKVVTAVRREVEAGVAGAAAPLPATLEVAFFKTWALVRLCSQFGILVDNS